MANKTHVTRRIFLYAIFVLALLVVSSVQAQQVNSLVLNFTIASELDGVLIDCPGNQEFVEEKKINCSYYNFSRNLTRYFIDDFFDGFSDVETIGPWQDVTSSADDISGFFRTYRLNGNEEVIFVLGLVEQKVGETILLVYIQP